MTFYADLSPYEYYKAPGLENALNVGWLSALQCHPIGRTTPEFRRRLFALCASPQHRFRGFHACGMGLCRFRWRSFGTRAVLDGHEIVLGSGIVVVRGGEHTYAAPDLIYHYVTRHWYRPPRAFVEAVLAPRAP